MVFKIGKALSEDELVMLCKQGKRSGQQEVYSRYSKKMFALCFRYLKNEFDAEEVLIAAFMKVFEKINQFEGLGSFEGWIRKITVHEALGYLRKNKNLFVEIEQDDLIFENSFSDSESLLHAEDLLKIINTLPQGYNTIFNLYAIEGYSHKEIASMLGISENTSKSQLSRARSLLQKLIIEKEFNSTIKVAYE